jgi:ribulose-5-phosphate 4-epimerase/fuculose-1-phosphate aldolase
MFNSDLITISELVAHRPDWVQGAGGNTSVKPGDGSMWIKASGKLLKEIATESAYVRINPVPILEALKTEMLDIRQTEERIRMDAVISNSVLPGINNGKPSMETGFHCLYPKYVLHTHSVYANIFLCSSHFQLLETCFSSEEDFSISLLGDYYTPGNELSWFLYDTYRFAPEMPHVTFLPNHGVIFSHQNLETLIKIHETVHHKLCTFLNLEPSNYPVAQWNHSDNTKTATCDFLFQVWETTGWESITRDLLFPDQAIYIGAADISDSDKTAKVFLDFNKRQIRFQTSLREAEGIMETMIAYFFILQQIKNRGYEPLTINFEFEKLRNMQDEQYRKQQLK